MTEAQKQAHERLLSTLPVRRHFGIVDDVIRKGGRKHTAHEAAKLRKKIKAMRAEGLSVTKIARKLKLSNQTIYNYSRERKDC